MPRQVFEASSDISFAANAPLAEVNWDTVYASGPNGYSDYLAYALTAH
jgi:N-ethylmaleimide reductase